MIQKGKMIGQGNTVEVYEYGEGRVLKLYREGIPDFLCKQEFEGTDCAYKKSGLAPKALEIVNIDGRVGAVYEKIEGKTFFEVLLHNIFKFKSNAKKLAKYHYLIHKEIDIDSRVIKLKDKLKIDIDAVDEKDLKISEKNKILSLLDKIDNGNSLCHFDFHPDNIIIRDKKPVIIDWMTACIGDPAADVARTCIVLKTGEMQTKSVLVKKIVQMFQNKLYQYYIEEYLHISNLSLNDIKKWEPIVAAARLREWISDYEKDVLHQIVIDGIKNI